ncbi:hypothetical protein [Fluviicola taffensis]|uniref:hypothetical protein n=1 Tax=Fluviicola taffensis TaxID=191579 RepID=UPI0031379522
MKDFQEIELSDSAKTERQKAIKTVYQLLILMGIEYVISICWFILQKVVIPIFFEKDGNTNWQKVSLLYKSFGWTMDILSVIALVIFSIIIPNKIARIFLFVFLGLKIIFIISYKILEQ